MSSIPIVVTSINDINSCLKALSSNDQFDLLYVADKKSPKIDNENIKFLSIEDQKVICSDLDYVMPFNTYSRKNFGYLHAYKNYNSTFLIETDDDNYPLVNFFNENRSVDVSGILSSNSKWVNAFSYFTTERVWPRGFPLEQVNKSFHPKPKDEIVNVLSPIQQELANGDTDTDAIFRLVYPGLDIEFSALNSPLVLDQASYCPFNSQSTVWFQLAWPLLYLPFSCSFRLVDIWRGYIAQKWLKNNDLFLTYKPPSMKQIRNEHNLISDFSDEIPGYLGVSRFCEVIDSIDEKEADKFLLEAYQFLIDERFFDPEEIEGVRAWNLEFSKGAAA